MTFSIGYFFVLTMIVSRLQVSYVFVIQFCMFTSCIPKINSGILIDVPLCSECIRNEENYTQTKIRRRVFTFPAMDLKKNQLSGIDVKMHLTFYTVKLGMHTNKLFSCHAQ